MKIGVTGSTIITNIIQTTLQKHMPELEVVYLPSDNYQDAFSLACRLQSMDLQGILFTGPTNYHYALKRLTPTIPWTYIPHSQASVLKALLEGSVRYQCNPDVISVDMYEKELVEESLRQAGIEHSVVYTPASGTPEMKDFEKELLEFHRFNYYHHGARLCLTNMEHILLPLQQEGIPCVRISTLEDLVLGQVYHLQVQELSARENRGSIGVVQIYFDFSFDQVSDLALREWEKIRYQSEMRELIYSIGHRMDAAVFPESSTVYYIMTSRRMLTDIFLRSGEHQKLLQLGQRSPYNRIWIGIGFGSTALEAKSRASMALNNSIADHSGSFYLVEDDKNPRGPFRSVPDISQRSYMIQQLHLSDASYNRLKEAIARHERGITSAQLAVELGITERSANRILLRLEQENCITTIGKRSSGKGRPARIMKITLP